MVAAGRDGERKCRGGKLFGHAVPCPACGAKLREERQRERDKSAARQKSPELVVPVRGASYSGHAVPCPACGAKLREDRAKGRETEARRVKSRSNWLPQEEMGKGSAGSGCLPQAFPVLRGKALQRTKKSGQIPMGLTAFELIWEDIKPYRSRKNSRILADTERYL